MIAIENTRLFEAEQASKRELQESLKYQTATGEVLGVISRSPSRIDLVFETMTRMAERLCQADFGFAYRRGKDARFHLVAASKAPEQYVLYRKQNPVTAGDGSILGRSLSERRAISVADVKSDSVKQETEAQRLGRVRSALAVPLMKDGEPALTAWACCTCCIVNGRMAEGRGASCNRAPSAHSNGGSVRT